MFVAWSPMRSRFRAIRISDSARWIVPGSAIMYVSSVRKIWSRKASTFFSSSSTLLASVDVAVDHRGQAVARPSSGDVGHDRQVDQRLERRGGSSTWWAFWQMLMAWSRDALQLAADARRHEQEPHVRGHRLLERGELDGRVVDLTWSWLTSCSLANTSSARFSLRSTSTRDGQAGSSTRRSSPSARSCAAGPEVVRRSVAC